MCVSTELYDIFNVPYVTNLLQMYFGNRVTLRLLMIIHIFLYTFTVIIMLTIVIVIFHCKISN